LTEKTARALYALLKELYQSRTAKDFVDTYEREQRHQSQAVPVNWSVEKDNAYHDLTEAIFKRKPLLTIQKAAITFADICNREERRKPEVSDVYRDIFGNKYIVTAVHDSFPDDARGNKPFIVLKHVESNGRIALSDYFSPYLEDFLNPTFKKV